MNVPGWAQFFMDATGMSDKKKCKKKKKTMDAQSQTPYSRPAGGTVRGRKKAKKKKGSK